MICRCANSAPVGRRADRRLAPLAEEPASIGLDHLIWIRTGSPTRPSTAPSATCRSLRAREAPGLADAVLTVTSHRSPVHVAWTAVGLMLRSSETANSRTRLAVLPPVLRGSDFLPLAPRPCPCREATAGCSGLALVGSTTCSLAATSTRQPQGWDGPADSGHTMVPGEAVLGWSLSDRASAPGPALRRCLCGVGGSH